MRGLLTQVLASPLNAAAVVAGLALLGRLQHPLLYVVWLCLSMAVLTLVVLRFGFVPGLRVALMAAAWLWLASMLGGLATSGVLLPFGLLALAVALSAMPMRWQMGPGTACTVAAVVVLVYVAGIRIATGDVDRWWLESLLALTRELPLGERAAEVEQQVTAVAGYMNTFIAGGTMAVVLVALGLGRFWQGLVTQVRLFRKEFLRLSLKRGTSAVGIAAFVLGTQGVVWREAAVLAGMLGCVVGLAVAHARLQGLPSARLVLMGVYAGLFVLPKLVVPSLVAVGYLDSVLDLRGQRDGSKGGGAAGPPGRY
jgi:hypothetical protein